MRGDESTTRHAAQPMKCIGGSMSSRVKTSGVSEHFGQGRIIVVVRCLLRSIFGAPGRVSPRGRSGHTWHTVCAIRF